MYAEIMKRHVKGESSCKCRSKGLRFLEARRSSDRHTTHCFTEPAAQDQESRQLSQTGTALPQWLQGSRCGALFSKQMQQQASETGGARVSMNGIAVSLRRCVFCHL